MADTTEVKNPLVTELFSVGAHFGYAKSKRHPTATPYIFGVKNRVELFDLEETAGSLEKTMAFVKALGAMRKQILFVAGKNEAREALKQAAESIHAPYVAGRFIGGTLTNFSEIKRRVDRLEKLRDDREKGLLSKYTKKERLLIDREIDRLEKNFGGIVGMKSLPGAVFVVDSKREHIAITEAKKMGIPTIALANSDCDMNSVMYSLPANDSSKASIAYFVHKLAKAYEEGTRVTPGEAAKEAAV
jgi:small subunit ribosomal protein S2